MRNSSAVRSIAEMPREPADTSPISLRVPNAWLVDLDELAVLMSRPGIELGRSDVVRAAIARGLQELKAEFPQSEPRRPDARPRKR